MNVQPLFASSVFTISSNLEVYQVINYDYKDPEGVYQNLLEDETTFYTLLRDSGYHVMGCGKFDLRKPAASWGRDGKHHVNGKCYLDILSPIFQV